MLAAELTGETLSRKRRPEFRPSQGRLTGGSGLVGVGTLGTGGIPDALVEAGELGAPVGRDGGEHGEDVGGPEHVHAAGERVGCEGEAWQMVSRLQRGTGRGRGAPARVAKPP